MQSRKNQPRNNKGADFTWCELHLLYERSAAAEIPETSLPNVC
jgi:hypothetical protein